MYAFDHTPNLDPKIIVYILSLDLLIKSAVALSYGEISVILTRFSTASVCMIFTDNHSRDSLVQP